MKYTIIIIVFCLSLLGCGGRTIKDSDRLDYGEKVENVEPQNFGEKKNKFVEKIPANDPFFDLFETINDEEWLFYAIEPNVYEDTEYKHIDFKYCKILSEILYKYSVEEDDTISLMHLKIFPINKIEISENIIGLVFLKMGMYSHSITNLVLYDKISEEFYSDIELSRIVGDGGWMLAKISWLADINNDGQKDIVTRRIEYYPNGLVGGPGGVDGLLKDSTIVYVYKDGFLEKAFVDVYWDSAFTESGFEYEIFERTNKNRYYYSNIISTDTYIDMSKYYKLKTFRDFGGRDLY